MKLQQTGTGLFEASDSNMAAKRKIEALKRLKSDLEKADPALRDFMKVDQAIKRAEEESSGAAQSGE